MILRLLLVPAFLGAVCAFAAEPQPVVIDYRAYTAPPERAFPLLKDLRSPRIGEAIRQLNELVRDGGAVLAGVQKLHAVAALKADAAGSEELRYPIEWGQPFGLGGLGWAPILGESLHDFVAPTTVETRDLGTSLEVTAYLDRNGVTLQISAAISRLTGWFRSPGVFTAAGVAVSYPQPRFTTSKIAAHVTIPTAKWILLSAQSAAAQSGYTTFHLVRVSIPEVVPFPQHP